MGEKMRILYATDGSKEALAGAQFLARLPLAPDCQVTLVTVLPETAKQDAEATLSEARAVLQSVTDSIGTEVAQGQAAEAILRAERARPADLIVVGSRGLTGLARFFLGSVAERVARHAPTPVLVARPLVNDLRRVILGFDGSYGAERAAEWLQAFPLPAECELLLTTVLPLLEAYYRPRKLDWPARLRSLYEEQIQDAQERLAALLAAFSKAGRHSRTELKSGDPADTLIRFAEESQADLMVVGARGVSALDRFLLGSVSEKVLRHAPCSVLVVR